MSDDVVGRNYGWLALSMYLGERCKYCGHKFQKMPELLKVVYVGYHKWGRIAHKSCWDKEQ